MKKYTYIIRSAALLQFFIIGVSSSLLAAEPNYDETVSYIVSKLKTWNSTFRKSSNKDHIYKRKISFPEKCLLRYEHSESADGILIERFTFEIPLSKIIPSRVDESGSYGAFLTTGEQDGIEMYEETIFQFPGNKNVWGLNIDDYSARVRDDDNPPACVIDICGRTETSSGFTVQPFEKNGAKGMQKAFRHLVLMCDGKEELF